MNEEKNPSTNGQKLLEEIQQIIFLLNNDNIPKSADSIYKNFDDNYSYSFNLIICQIIYSFFIISMKNIDIILDFMKKIETLEENNKNKTKIFDVFACFLLRKDTRESFYLLKEIIERGIINPENIQRNNPNFVFNLSDEEIEDIYSDAIIHNDQENYSKLSENDFELHKKLIKEGVNPNEMPKIIRNDDIEKLQEISSQTNFDFNQIIEPSIYEICSFINKENVTLIDYAAFFGSIKCFKYLLMNGAKVENTGKYAVASGNLEIMHLCEQNHSTFKGAYETAIKYHRNDIFKYIYNKELEGKPIQSSDSDNEDYDEDYNKNSDNGDDDNENEEDDEDDTSENHSSDESITNSNLKRFHKLQIACISNNNYELLSYLNNDETQIDDDVINNSAKIGNIILVKYFLQNNPIPNDILVYSSESGNIELVKYILNNYEIDINAKNVFLIKLEKIFIIFCF